MERCFKSLCHFVLDTDSQECDPHAPSLSTVIECHSNTNQNKRLLFRTLYYKHCFSKEINKLHSVELHARKTLLVDLKILRKAKHNFDFFGIKFARANRWLKHAKKVLLHLSWNDINRYLQFTVKHNGVTKDRQINRLLWTRYLDCHETPLPTKRCVTSLHEIVTILSVIFTTVWFSTLREIDIKLHIKLHQL